MLSTSRKQHTHSRAQTPHDFALGIGIFILTVAFTLAFIPASLSFTDADPGATETTLSDRSAVAIIGNLSTGARQNELNATATAEYFDTVDNESDLQDRLDLPETTSINATIRSLDDAVVLQVDNSSGYSIRLDAGRRYPETQPAAETSRVVTMTEDVGMCTPGCQLVVRVW